MKMMLTALGLGLGMTVVGLAELGKPGTPEAVPSGLVDKDRGLYVFPGEESGLVITPEIEEESEQTWRKLEALSKRLAGAPEDALDVELLAQPGKDLMLAKLMAEMLKEAKEDQKEMEAPVELPKLDAPELQRLLRGGKAPGWVPNIKRWTLGVHLKADIKDRIMVNDVIPDSPADRAGLMAGDDLQAVNGILLRDHAMLVDLIQVIRGQEVELGVLRGEEEVKVKITASQMDLPDVDFRKVAPQEAPVAPKLKVVPKQDGRDDEVLKELRGMRGLMEQMLQELRKQSPARPSRVRRVPTSPQNR